MRFREKSGKVNGRWIYTGRSTGEVRKRVSGKCIQIYLQ